jgi:hypothetical protein
MIWFVLIDLVTVRRRGERRFTCRACEGRLLLRYNFVSPTVVDHLLESVDVSFNFCRLADYALVLRRFSADSARKVLYDNFGGNIQRYV